MTYDHSTWQCADFGEEVQFANAKVATGFLFIYIPNLELSQLTLSRKKETHIPVN